MTTEKKLTIIGMVSFAVAFALYFVGSGPSYAGFSGFVKSTFEIGLMAFLLFLVLSINFFAISFFVKSALRIFRKSTRS